MKVGSSIPVATLPQRPPATEHEPIKRLTQVQFQWQQLNLPQTTAAVAVAAGAAATGSAAVTAGDTCNHCYQWQQSGILECPFGGQNSRCCCRRHGHQQWQSHTDSNNPSQQQQHIAEQQ